MADTAVKPVYKNVQSVPAPDFWKERVEKFEKILAAQPKIEGKPIKITLPDGSVRDGVAGESSPLSVAQSISQGLAQAVVVARVNGKVWDLQRPLEEDCSLELVKFDSEEGRDTFWHSSAHILGWAMEKLYGAHLTHGPPNGDGFFYDGALPNGWTVDTNDFKMLELLVKSFTKQKAPFQRIVATKEEALDLFSYNKYKQYLIGFKIPDGGTCTVYRCGDLIDLCTGPHLPHTGRVKAFKVVRSSGAFWLGKDGNDVLQRLTAISFPDPKLLKQWVAFKEEAAKRDHRRIGEQQDLFTMLPIAPGCAFFRPHGTRIYNTLLETMRREQRKRGFLEVITPNVFHTDLWKTSGHLPNYEENIFKIEIEKAEHALKPMNCPGHCELFRSKARSHRDLPLRFAEWGVLHRNELAGALSGLTRVRRFVQDDAHIFCTMDQVEGEIASALEFMDFIYTKFGFLYTFELSTRPEKFLGEIEIWDKAEAMLKNALDGTGKKWELNEGDGAFYGPKIDIHIEDALRRSYQCATIQLDFNLPERFNLHYAGASKDEERPRPVMIHRAIYGSLERFFAIVTEHLGGKWPFWLSPRQVMLVPVDPKFSDYAKSVHERLFNEGYNVDVDYSGNTLNKKIRNAQVAQYNFILVVGANEVENNSVNIRTRDNQVHGEKTVDEVLAEFRQLVEDWK